MVKRLIWVHFFFLSIVGDHSSSVETGDTCSQSALFTELSIRPRSRLRQLKQKHQGKFLSTVWTSTTHCVTQFKLKYTPIKQPAFSITTNTWREAFTGIKNTLPDFTWVGELCRIQKILCLMHCWTWRWDKDNFYLFVMLSWKLLSTFLLMHFANIFNITWLRNLSFFKCILPVRNLFILSIKLKTSGPRHFRIINPLLFINRNKWS